MKRKYGVLMLALFAAVLAAGCVQQSGFSTTIPEGATVVEISPNGFSPSSITINAGDTVAWVNRDTAPHWPASAQHPTHAVYPEPGGCISSKFDACAGLKPGEVFSFTFTHAGEWKYHDHLNCCTNPALFGTIVVK